MLATFDGVVARSPHFDPLMYAEAQANRRFAAVAASRSMQLAGCFSIQKRQSADQSCRLRGTYRPRSKPRG